MELPLISDLTTHEKKGRVEISPQDPSRYPQFYYWPFKKILEYTSSFPAPPPKEWESEFGQSNWDESHNGYVGWAVPYETHNFMESMNRMFYTQMIYNKLGSVGGSDYPEIQLKKLFAAPIERSLVQYSETVEHQVLQQKIFVMKYSLAPCHISNSNDSGGNDRVWRLIACYGETKLSTLHDRILGPSMGWTRHYHSYQFVIPTNGASFGPEKSDAIDHMHTLTNMLYSLDADKYQLSQVLREPGQRLVYIYDLGDTWVHNIELIQVADKGDVLQLPNDVQVKSALLKQYASKLPELSGVQLFVGELNCPPEDSNGCDGMGRYGNLLNKGTKHCSVEAVGSTNWKEHKIKNAYDFDLEAHKKRLNNAIIGKSSAKGGHKKCIFPLGGGSHNNLFENPTGPGEKLKHQCLGNLHTGCIPMTETIKTRPDMVKEAVCASCGRQPNNETGGTRLLRCANCKAAWYCGQICQKSDWDNHKERCRKMKKERLAYKKEKSVSTEGI